MKLINFEKVKDGTYLKNYELTYLNKAGNEKKYEIVSRMELEDISELGTKSSGVSIAAICEGKLLLLREFRMGINKEIYNLCAGMINKDESIEDCVKRELYEEPGLPLKRIIKVLDASYAAVAISDTMTNIVFVEVEGTFSDHTSDNESIKAGLYSKEEVANLLETAQFSSRAQVIAYFFTENPFV